MRWWQIRRRDADLERELRSDLELEEEEQAERGLPPEKARIAAHRAFGNTALIKDQTHEAWGLGRIERIGQDVRFAFRSARRTPLLTSIVVLALSIGIGLNVGVFSILNSLFLAPPTRKDPASFVQVFPRYEGWFAGAAQISTFNSEDFNAVRTQTRSLSDVAAWSRNQITLDDLRKQDSALLVTCNYFQVFGIDRVVMGRFFLANECRPGAEARVTVISEHLWRQSYASDPQIIGKVIHISRQPFVVIGILADDGSANVVAGSVWIPYTLQPALNHGKSNFNDPALAWLGVAGRLRQGYTRSDARAEVETILRQRDRFYVEQKAFTLNRKTSVVVTNGSFIENPVKLQAVAAGLFALIMGPLLLVLLLACTNVTMLFLSRSIVRRGEIAVRIALGAGRARLMRMLTVESLLTALLAGLISIWLAVRIPSLVIQFIDPEGHFPAMHTDWRVFGFLAALVLISAIVSALAPMRESFRFDLVTALKGREGSVTTRTGTASLLIVAQLAMSFVLLVAAVLFARLPSTIESIDAGFETHHLMTVPLDISIPPYTRASALDLYRTLEAHIIGMPGVQSLASASIAPFSSTPQQEVRLNHQKKGLGQAASVDSVSLDFFSTFGIPLLHGRTFLPSDLSASANARVAIVSQAFARAFWGIGDPVGKILVTADDRHLTVIGVSADTRSEQFGILDGPRVYTLADSGLIPTELFVRFTGDATSMAKRIEETVKTLDPNQVVIASTMWDFLESNATEMRALGRIVLFMAGIALALAITGVYAVLTFAMNRRTREFAIQMMLGATRESIFHSVMKKGLQQIAIGLVCGLILAVPAAWVFARMTAQSSLPIHAFDLSVYGISALILLVVSLCAMGLPGLRATRVDPAQALRAE